jgi:hypothetical protein
MTMAAAAITWSKRMRESRKLPASLALPDELFIEAFTGLVAVGRLKRPAPFDVFVVRDIGRASSFWPMPPAATEGVMVDVRRWMPPPEAFARPVGDHPRRV